MTIKAQPLRTQFTIVLVGSFNPIIFHPQWFINKGLVARDELTDDKDFVIDQSKAHFIIGKWLDVLVTRDRCQLSTIEQDKIIVVRDIVKRICSILPESPIIGLGINISTKYTLIDDKSYLEFGKKLSNLALWQATFENPRLHSISIQDTGSKDYKGTNRTVFIKPADSEQNENEMPINYCVEISINNHYEDRNPDNRLAIIKAIELIEENAFLNYEQFKQITNNILSIQ
jgi:hypothetical protein